MVKRWWMIDKLSNSLERAKIDKEICFTKFLAGVYELLSVHLSLSV